MPEHRITDVARLTGTNTSTLRLWEQHGLLAPKRSTSGQRIFDDADIATIRAIQRMRKVDGLNMSAIRKALLDQVSSVSDRGSQGGVTGNKTTHPDDDSRVLGVRFRLARQKAKMSLREAAEASGLPISFISTFERTAQGATVASLQALASSYGTTVTELSRSGTRRTDHQVVRHGKERVAPSFGPDISILQLAESLDLLDCQKWVLQPGAESSGFYAHKGEEFIHVLSGEFHISLDGVENSLKPGDSVAFESQRPHAWRAGNDEPTILVWVNTPKSF
ncbi:MAG: Transcriptional regulator, MerR family [uncultured Paraburkholderia sp.]|uniref:MerR family transcriptional regulator n=1 Tax=uncultured Paraburkholderia sp. TaxID=1822466 RepID=UPI002596D3D0|nr:MerR family transcriptional regulator [uncultured Paraburkholderia sp.]CAH2903775.1 MAG: Transcriptional regulator, MerR family [uncultured Paraburkholderia sp.]CAH2941479.1 MAG: Transcriptional regulator, MerR family [uncultured Paraburkholderia sp.]